MRIGIDYRFALTTRGIGYYVKSVVKALSTLDKVNLYYLYVDQEVQLDLPPNFKLILIKCKNLIWFEQYELPKRAKQDNVNVLWYPSNSGPLFLHSSISLIVSVHDLNFVKTRIPDFAIFNSRKKLRFALAELYRSVALNLGLKRVDSLITVSEYSANEILKKLHRIAITISNQIHPLPSTPKNTDILQRLNINHKEYIFTLTGEAPHKGLANYIKLFFNRDTAHPLVISGVYDPSIMKKYASPNIIFSGYITDDEKNVLYANAYCFLFLSLNEGFGLPLLEAMQHQLPIICTNKGALTEVGGDAVLLVEPNDHDHIWMLLTHLEAYLPSNLKLLQRQQLSKYESWENSASAHLKLFKEVRS